MLFLLRIIPSFNRSLPLSQFRITVTRLVPNILFFYNKVKCPHLQKKVGLVFPSITVHKFGSVFQNFIAGVTTLLHVVSNTEILYLCMCVMYENNYSHAMHILSSVRLNSVLVYLDRGPSRTTVLHLCFLNVSINHSNALCKKTYLLQNVL